MSDHWFMVASKKEVRIYAGSPEAGQMILLKSLINPLGQTKRADLIHKEAGRGMKSIGRHSTVRYSEPKRHDPLENSLKQFARSIVHFLEGERQQHRFATLTVVAEPHFLGKLKAEMRPLLRKCVFAWIKKDLQNTPKNLLSDLLLQ